MISCKMSGITIWIHSLWFYVGEAKRNDILDIVLSEVTCTNLDDICKFLVSLINHTSCTYELSHSPEAEDELLEGPVGEEDAEAVLVEVVAREDLEEVLRHAVQLWSKEWSPGSVNFVIAVGDHSYLNLPEKFSQPGTHFLAQPCTRRPAGCPRCRPS